MSFAGSSALDRRHAAFRAVLALSTFAMLARSWKLWLGDGEFPRVPFVQIAWEPPPFAGWIIYSWLLATVIAGSFSRKALGISLAILAVLVAADQHRLQPWAYQYLVCGFAFAAASRAEALRLCRWFFAALYVHSALSKLDASFALEMGPAMLSVVDAKIGTRLASIRGLALMMPALEFLVGVGLIWPRTRRISLVGAVAIHAALLLILGPWGLNHSLCVLIWNAAMLAEVVILFAPAASIETSDSGRHTLEPIARAVMILAASLPFLEPWGYWDTWPSFGLYASHNERVELWWRESELNKLPAHLSAQARRGRTRADDFGELRLLDLNAWSLEQRGTPLYPQGRAQLGLAMAIVKRYHGSLATIVYQDRADRMTRRRKVLALHTDSFPMYEDNLSGSPRAAPRFWLNGRGAWRAPARARSR